MKKAGLLINKSRIWSITQKGKEFLSLKERGNKNFINWEEFQDNRAKARTLMVIFDIPEKKKKYREWLRDQLVGMGFNMIQKSVWFGPGVSKEFVEYLDELRILKFVRFFRAAEKDLI